MVYPVFWCVCIWNALTLLFSRPQEVRFIWTPKRNKCIKDLSFIFLHFNTHCNGNYSDNFWWKHWARIFVESNLKKCACVLVWRVHKYQMYQLVPNSIILRINLRTSDTSPLQYSLWGTLLTPISHVFCADTLH